MSEEVEIRVYGDASQPTLIYLPGLHGDWTLIGGFRQAVVNRVRFAEIAYPRTLTWSLDDYAGGVERALAQRGIGNGWLLGESFGSQVAWQLSARGRFHAEGIVLAGGFVRHPLYRVVPLVQSAFGVIPLRAMTAILFGYAKVSRFRFRHSPEVRRGVEEFLARRTDVDRRAATHRLHLVAHSDPRAIARRVGVPVFALTGLVDPIVPWFWVRPWLKRYCPQLRDYRIIKAADHNVLATAPQRTAEQVLRWMLGPVSA